jgi:hypothetical protein
MVLQQGLAGIHRVFIAPGAASVVANRFGDDLVIVRFNIRKSGVVFECYPANTSLLGVAPDGLFLSGKGYPAFLVTCMQC